MLHELVAYADKHLEDSEPGFKTREVRWSIELAADGRFLGILPLGDGKRGADLPRCPDMHGMNAGGKSHFLVESAQTVALLFKANEDDKKIVAAQIRHGFYTQLLREAAKSEPQLGLLADALEDDTQRDEIRTALATQRAKPFDQVTWRIDGRDPRLENEVQAWWRKRLDGIPTRKPTAAKSAKKDLRENGMTCFVTGLPVVASRTHPKIVGLPGDKGKVNSLNDVLVGFDKPAFRSYGLGKV